MRDSKSPIDVATMTMPLLHVVARPMVELKSPPTDELGVMPVQ